MEEEEKEGRKSWCNKKYDKVKFVKRRKEVKRKLCGVKRRLYVVGLLVGVEENTKDMESEVGESAEEKVTK